MDGGRVAFYWKKGFGPDNWVGLIHDPTGDVMRPLDSPLSGGDPFSTVRLIFGGTLYHSPAPDRELVHLLVYFRLMDEAGFAAVKSGEFQNDGTVLAARPGF